MHVFNFEDNPQRRDGWTDQSVNWEDDPEAIPFILSQSKGDGKPQFEVGLAVLPRPEIDRLKLNPGYAVLSYERQPFRDNRYHGNLLIPNASTKPFRRAIAGALASRVVRIIRRE